MTEPTEPRNVHGIVDVADNAAFVRTNGFHEGPNDAYIPNRLLTKTDLRPGDLVSGTAAHATGKQRFGPLLSVDSVNGVEPGSVRRNRFADLTPVYPHQRLRLETTPSRLTARVIDLVMPIGKGQRALVVSPPKAGKTTVLQEIATGITANHPDCILMVLLVDERPEEVTDMRRTVSGEIISSTFDRPPHEHVAVAELTIERAKRLVESGHDVVLLLDSITRLGRAYNQTVRNGGRILSGGIDAATLHPMKKILGAARAIEGGGSLTIVGTSMVENGSVADTVYYEELKSTGNAELKLDRRIAEGRTFPAVDITASSTRREDLLLAPDELVITTQLHRALAGTDSQHAINQLLDQLRRTSGNRDFLRTIAATTPPTTRSKAA